MVSGDSCANAWVTYTWMYGVKMEKQNEECHPKSFANVDNLHNVTCVPTCVCTNVRPSCHHFEHDPMHMCKKDNTEFDAGCSYTCYKLMNFCYLVHIPLVWNIETTFEASPNICSP